ncbi:MAG: hypothetical protein JWP61_2905 [Friedmanniella sp.]|nr:hypothetical protein [Friedmanniella sp.]
MKQTENIIVVGIDDSPSSRAALTWAAAQAREVGARLRALHVLAWPVDDNPFAFEVAADTVYPDLSRVEEVFRDPSRRLFDECRPEPDWELRLAHGHAGRILVQESQGALMLVVGCREHVGLGRLLAGSVSHYCLSHAVCPVVAVPVGPATVGSPAEPAGHTVGR